MKHLREKKQEKALHTESRLRRSFHRGNQLQNMQQDAGNQALNSFFMQPKLKVSQAADPYESEADQIAESVMGMPVAENRVAKISPVQGHVQRSCTLCEEEQLLLRKTSQEGKKTNRATAADIRSATQGGEPLDPQSRTFYEPRFGRSFEDVRVHTDGLSGQLAQDINARAFTVGNHLVFGYDEYQPETSSGQQLLAHELVHVVQQDQSGQRIQRWPLDGEMVTLTAAYQSGDITFSSGDSVEVVEWDAGSGMARVQLTPPYEHAYEPVLIPHVFLSTGAESAEERPQIIAEMPIEFVAEPVPDSSAATTGLNMPLSTSILASGEGPESAALAGPGSLMSSTGLSLHHLAMGDMGFLPRSQAGFEFMTRMGLSPRGRAGFDFMTSRTYWESFLPRRGTTVMDRFVGLNRTPSFPADYTPRIETESWRAGELGRHALNFTDDELRSVPQLLNRLVRHGAADLTTRELQILLVTADMHVGGTPTGSPWVSFCEPNPRDIGDLSWLVDEATPDSPRYRIRVEVPSTSALDLRGGPGTPLAQAFDEDAVRQLLDNLPNPDEMELVASSSDDARLRGVQAITGADNATPGFLMRHGNKIRWGGRVLVVAGLAYSGYRIGTASEEERAQVIGEEAGSQALGAAGAALAAAGCVALGIATGGVGLFVCGLVGGIAGGVGGHYLGGELGEAVEGGIEAVGLGIENDPAAFILPAMPTLRSYGRHGRAFPRTRSPLDVMNEMNRR